MRSLVSVIVPSYNYEKYIVECIKSIEAQEYKEIELIIIDDCSSDNSVRVILNYIEQLELKNRFSNIIFRVHKKNMGAHYTINEAIEIANGKYISIINADDLYTPNRFSTIIPSMEKKNCLFAFSAVEIIDSNSCIAYGDEAEYFREIQKNIDGNSIVSHELISQNVAISTGNFVFEKKLYWELGGFSEYKYIHDWDFILRASLICEPMYFKETKYLYRLHEVNSFRELDDVATYETDIVLSEFFRKVLAKRSKNKNITPKTIMQFINKRPYYKKYFKQAFLPVNYKRLCEKYKCDVDKLIKNLKYKALIGLFISSIVFIFGFFLLINFNTPMMGEDYALVGYSPYLKEPELAEKILLIFKRSVHQTSTFNARIGEQISILFGSFNKMWFNLANSILSLGFIYLMFLYAFTRKIRLNSKTDFSSVLISFILVILFIPALGEVFFWRTGSCNYLWATSILLLFGLPYRYLLAKKNILENKKVLPILHTILGFLAGFTNENTVISFIVLCTCIILYKIKNNERIYLWMYTGLTALISGFAILITCPSTKIRIELYNKIYNVGEVTLTTYLSRVSNVIYRFFNDNIILVAMAAIILAFYIIIDNKSSINVLDKKKYRINSPIITENFLMLIIASLSVGALVGSPYIESRSFLLANFFIIAFIIALASQIFAIVRGLKLAIINAILLIMCLYTFNICFTIYATYRDYYNVVNQRTSNLLEDKKHNVLVPVVKLSDRPNNRILNNMEYHIKDYQFFANYFGFEKLRFSGSGIYSSLCIEIDENYIANILYGIDYYDIDNSKKVIQVTGWALIEDTDASQDDVYVALKSNEKILYFKTASGTREDVEKYFNKKMYKYSGFYTRIDISNDDVQPGRYNIGIVVKNPKTSQNGIQFSDKYIQIND